MLLCYLITNGTLDLFDVGVGDDTNSLTMGNASVRDLSESILETRWTHRKRELGSKAEKRFSPSTEKKFTNGKSSGAMGSSL